MKSIIGMVLMAVGIYSCGMSVKGNDTDHNIVFTEAGIRFMMQDLRKSLLTGNESGRKDHMTCIFRRRPPEG